MPSDCTPSISTRVLGGKWLSGASCNGVADGSFETWRGSPVGIAGTWNDTNTAVQREQWSMSSSGEYSSWSQAVDAAVGGFYGGSWAQAASGAYDDDWRTALRNIYDGWGTKTTVFVRFAHEFNGDWYDWSVGPEDNEAFKASWIRFYNIFKEELVDKQKDARLVWSPNNGGHRMNTTENWPGDQYVDVIGPDYYNWDPSTNNQAEWDAKFMMKDSYGGPLGLGAWQEFARQHGKPIALPEWGSNGNGPDDQPEFIKMMNTWMTQNGGSGPGQLIYDIYFNCGDNWGGNFQIYPELALPQESAMYKSLKWGQ